jgi:hypothetical protein
LSAAPPVRRRASTQGYLHEALDNAVRLISKLICINCSLSYRIHCIAKAFCDQQKFAFDVQLVRTLCQEITEEKDPPTVEEFLNLPQAVIKDDQEEVTAEDVFSHQKMRGRGQRFKCGR